MLVSDFVILAEHISLLFTMPSITQNHAKLPKFLFTAHFFAIGNVYDLILIIHPFNGCI